MKKKVVSILLCAAMVSAMAMGCSSEAPASDSGSEDSGSEEGGDGSLTIGITIQSLKNDYWAGVMSKLEELMKDKGYEYTLIDCEDNAATQVGQIENFVTTGVDVIMVHPSDPDAIETACKEALDAGVKVMCWDDEMENTTANWVLDNTALGEEIGKLAAEFINENFTADDKAEVCVIGYPSTKVLLERQQGIESGLEKYCEDNYEIVATTEGLEAPESQTNVETVLQAHPDCQVFVGTGAGPMNGANQALLQHYGGAGKIPANVGVFTTDVTMQQLDSIKAGDEAAKGIVGFEGSNTDTASACLEMIEKVAAAGDDDFQGEDHNSFRPTSVINMDNIDDILAGM